MEQFRKRIRSRNITLEPLIKVTMNKINSSSFSAILQRGIDKENKRREKSRLALSAAMARQGVKSGPILLSALVRKPS